MKRLLVILIALLIASCSGKDYSIEDSMTQTLNAENINYLIVECYCDNGVDVKKNQNKEIKIDIKGKLESAGYHGEQETPNEIGQEALSFQTEVKHDTLRLVSKEWTYIHHSYLIDELKIQIPQGIKYEIIKISGEQLEGREIK